LDPRCGRAREGRRRAPRAPGARAATRPGSAPLAITARALDRAADGLPEATRQVLDGFVVAAREVRRSSALPIRARRPRPEGNHPLGPRPQAGDPLPALVVRGLPDRLPLERD